MQSVGAVKAALVELLRATYADDAEPVQVTDGPVGTEVTRGPRLVEVGEVTGTDELDSMGLGSTADTYVVTITASVTLQDPEGMRTAREAALDLWDRGRTVVREHPTGDLGLEASGVLGARPSRDWRLFEFPLQQGRSAAVRWGVQIVAQAT